jgi:hypothetical protein
VFFELGVAAVAVVDLLEFCYRVFGGGYCHGC